eukprot:Skav229875  [mRNA]  locus=scaffold247:224836:225275:- [translate_table: standard]
MAATFALALALATGSALAPTPLARADPVPAKRSVAVTGFLPSSTTAAAEKGGTGADLALGAAPAAPAAVAGPALAGLRVLTPLDPPVMVEALLVGAADVPWVLAVLVAFFCSSAFGADTSAGLATGTTLGAAAAGVVP